MVRYFILYSLFMISLPVWADQLKIKSDPPDAVVSIKDLNSTQNIKLGATPFEGNLNEMASNFVKSNFFLIVIEKPGYESQSILLSDLLKSDIELNLNLLPKEDILHYRQLDKSISDLFESQRLMRMGQYDEAQTLLRKIENDQPKLSIVPEFMGAASYLKKDNKGALVWYEKAYRMNPDNKDAFTMKSYLRKASGGEDEKK